MREAIAKPSRNIRPAGPATARQNPDATSRVAVSNREGGRKRTSACEETFVEYLLIAIRALDRGQHMNVIGHRDLEKCTVDIQPVTDSGKFISRAASIDALFLVALAGSAMSTLKANMIEQRGFRIGECAQSQTSACAARKPR